MKTLIMITMILSQQGFAKTKGDAVAIPLDFPKCEAAQRAAANIAKNYISSDLNCSLDSDCHEVNYVGGSQCEPVIVNNMGHEGFGLLEGNQEYMRLSEIVQELRSSSQCGSIPVCAGAQAPASRTLKCLEVSGAKICAYEPQ